MGIEVDSSPSDQLLAQTQEMLSCAEAGEWERLAELEQSRLPLFHQVFDQGISGKEGLARKVLSIDEKTMELAKSAMPALQQDLLKMRNSGKANTTYQTVQDFSPLNK